MTSTATVDTTRITIRALPHIIGHLIIKSLDYLLPCPFCTRALGKDIPFLSMTSGIPLMSVTIISAPTLRLRGNGIAAVPPHHGTADLRRRLERARTSICRHHFRLSLMSTITTTFPIRTPKYSMPNRSRILMAPSRLPLWQ